MLWEKVGKNGKSQNPSNSKAKSSTNQSKKQYLCIFSKTTNKKFGKKLWDFVFLLAQPPMSPVLRALASPKGLKGKNPRPSAAVRRILGAKKPTKGGGGARARRNTKFNFQRIIELWNYF